MKTVSKVFLGIACACIGIGIIIGMVGYSIGGRGITFVDNTYSYSYEVSNVDSIQLDVSFGYVNVVEGGDEFRVSVDRVTKDGFHSYVDGSTWVMKQDKDMMSTIHFFGWDIPFTFPWHSSSEDDYPKIVVTVPKDFEAKNLTLNLGAGDMSIEELTTNTAEFEIGAGRMEIRNFLVKDDMDCDVGAGELVIDKLNAKNVDIDCGVGSTKMTGEVLGNLKANCGMGEIILDLSGNEEDYNYKVSCGAGNIELNNHTYSIGSEDKIYNEGAIGTFDLDCSVGHVKVNIH